LNEDRCILSAEKLYANDSSFWKHKVDAEASNESWVVNDGNFGGFRWLLLRKLQR